MTARRPLSDSPPRRSASPRRRRNHAAGGSVDRRRRPVLLGRPGVQHVVRQRRSTVTARYRCFIPSPCNRASGPVRCQFTLTPRESRVVRQHRGARSSTRPNTAGGIEFDFTGGSGQLVVTSRLYSTEPESRRSACSFPGLKNSEAHATTVLTSIRNGGPSAPTSASSTTEDSAVDRHVHDLRRAAPRSATPVTRSIAGPLGRPGQLDLRRRRATRVTPTDNAVIVVSASHEVFSYAAVIDNATTDPIFVRGAEDRTPVASAGQPHGPCRPGHGLPGRPKPRQARPRSRSATRSPGSGRDR